MIFHDNMEDYLSESDDINWRNPAILEKAASFREKTSDEICLIKMIYEFVRDEIRHSWDVQDPRVTKSAIEVLEEGVGICWAKANLLAALLRACGIPAGICYQRLTLGDTPETGFCIHALNAVYIKSLQRWVRLDARGNKETVNAQFCLEREQLAFAVRREIGEVDYNIVYANPSTRFMKLLAESSNILSLYLHSLPDTLFEYKRTTAADLEELVRTRLIVLRAANKLSDDADMRLVENASFAYYQRALDTGAHIAYLVYEKYGFVAAEREMELP